MTRTNDANVFGWRCPYTDKHCEDWECDSCNVDKTEKGYIEDLDYDQDSEGGLIADD